MLRREEGQTMTEYRVVLGMIVIVTVAAYVLLGDAVTGLLQTVSAAV